MKWTCFLIPVFFLFAANGQSYVVRYVPDTVQVSLRTTFPDRQAAEKYVAQVPGMLLAGGYLAASIDRVVYDSMTAKVELYAGTRYRWGAIGVPLEYRPILKKDYHPGQQSGRPIPGNLVADWQQTLLDHFANNGHPFARVGLDSVRMDGDLLFGKMMVEEGPLYKIDSIQLLGTLKLKPGFIYPYLHIEKGMAYRQDILDNIDRRLSELPFAEVVQPHQLQMLGSGSIVNLYLQPRRSNIINALLAISPVSSQTPGNKLLLSGEVNLLLRNSFSLGETVGINWQQLQYKSPRLNLLYQQPYLFGSQAGIDFGFDLLKKDSQYVNLNFRIGVPYDFTGSRTGKVFFQQLSTNVTYVDTNLVKASRRLPDLANVSSSNLGLEYHWNTTDYRLNPRSGFEWLVSGAAGLKRIRKNNSVVQLRDPTEPGYSFESLYDTVNLKTYQLRLQMMLAKYLATGRQTVLKLAMNTGLYQSENYYRNELFQVGGSKLLRGFDEESIFARSYAVGTVEFRYLTGRNSYFFVFSDGGYAGYKDQALKYGHTYIGGGLGLALETKTSVINLSWANGKRNDLPFQFRQSRIHIGFVNFF